MIKSQIFGSLLIILVIVFINTANAVDISVNNQKSTSSSVVVKEETRSSKTIVIGNKDTKRYHLPGMPYYNKIKKYHRIYFDSEQQAIDKGYYKAGTGKNLNGSVRSVGAEIEKPGKTETVEKLLKPIDDNIHVEVKAPSPVLDSAAVVISYKIVIAFTFFIILFFLPFLPAIVEIIRKQDGDPLFIPMDYNKDPRYFCKSFKQILQKAIIGLHSDPQISVVMLSQKEKIQKTESICISAGAQVENLLYVQGDIVSDVNAHFRKEVYVSGNADIGAGNVLRVLAADGNMTIAAGTTFERWLDSQGNLDVGSDCHLGISASCGGRLNLAGDCSFRRLYGMPVTTGNVRDAIEINSPTALSAKPTIEPESSFIRKTDSAIAEWSILNGHSVFLTDVRIGHHSVVNGSIKCYGDIEMEENVTIYGNVFADGKITIGKGAIISGHVFSQDTIIVSENSVISRPGVVKSVLGKKSVCLAPNVTIYGFISTEGKGKVI